MENVVLTIHLILALLLVGVVLLQRSEGGGLMGGGGSMQARPAVSGLAKVTWILATAFIITSITLTIIATRGGDGGSVVDQLPAEGAVVPEAPAATDLLTPAPDAPATPEKAED